MTSQTKRSADATEIDLVRRAKAGEERAFAAIYQAYADRVYRFLRYRAPDQASAEDLTSEVFLRAWDKLDTFDPQGAPIGAWLFRIARNLAIDHDRLKKPIVSLDEIPPQDQGAPASLEDRLSARLEGDRVMNLLDELTNDQREVLVLKFVEGLPTAQVAQVLGKRQGAIRALQMRGLQALGDRLQAEATEGTQ